MTHQDYIKKRWKHSESFMQDINLTSLHTRFLGNLVNGKHRKRVGFHTSLGPLAMPFEAPKRMFFISQMVFLFRLRLKSEELQARYQQVYAPTLPRQCVKEILLYKNQRFSNSTARKFFHRSGPCLYAGTRRRSAGDGREAGGHNPEVDPRARSS